MPIEVYYFNKNEFILTKSEIDYVQLNSGTPYNGYSELQQANLYDESSGNKAGKFYSTRFIQGDSSDDTINLLTNVTLSLQNGILVFTADRNDLNLKIGDVYYFTPSYQSGVYLKKNVEILREIFQETTGLIYKYTIIY
jgi:hypothetical protein